VSAAPAAQPCPELHQADLEWAELAAAAPQLVETMRRYLRQIATFLAPGSVVAAEAALRIFARGIVANTTIVAVQGIGRDQVEEFKVYLAGRRGVRGGPLADNTQRQRLRMLRVFFERIIEWDWPDAPMRNPILNWDLPKRPEPLPRWACPDFCVRASG
jgi:Phage integrase, N-terminal SAM-like domain